jgi:hypothetical protein
VAAPQPDHERDLEGKGLAEVAEDKIQVTAIKGPLEEDWQHKAEAFAARIPIRA